MCGLVGYYGVTGEADMTAFRNLMFFNQIRGMHSTGVYARYSSEGKSALVKAVGGLERWSMTKEAKKIASENTMKLLPIVKFPDPKDKNKTEKWYPDVLLGHGRLATLGEINKKNAHPFSFSSIVGMHNGTMHKHWLKSIGWDGKITDSEFLLNKINDVVDDEDKLERLLESFQGEFCFVWYNFEKDEMSFFRNTSRPLNIRLSYTGARLAFASERWYLDMALEKAGVSGYFKPPASLDPRTLLTITWDFDKNEIKNAVTKKIGTPKSFFGNYSDYGELGGWGSRPYALPKPSTGGGGKVYNLSETVRKRVGASVHRYVTRNEFEKLVVEGCVCCNTPFEFEKAEEIWWFDNESPVCNTCRAEFFGDVGATSR